MENLGTSLWITLIGMGLVFIAIILLWGVMSFLVTILKEKEHGNITQHTAQTTISDQEIAIKEKIAAVAVAIAINNANQSPYEGEHPEPSSGVSNWQSSFRQTSS